MEDSQILKQYLERNEEAISSTLEKYERYLYRITYNILADHEDCKEILNDVCQRAWDSIPPQKPAQLGAYLSSIARRLAIDRLRSRNRKKQIPASYLLPLSELEECVSNNDMIEEFDSRLLAAQISAYLRTLPKQTRILFLKRYYYVLPLKEAAAECGMTAQRAKSLLYRARQGLKAHLLNNGFCTGTCADASR